MDITKYLADCIINGIPVSFSKYGDGEYSAANGHNGANCDNDIYTTKLSESLRLSFEYMVDKSPNSYIGIWTDNNHVNYWSSIVKNPIKLAKYHTLIMDSDNRKDKVHLFKTIKESQKKKIYICNPLLIRAQGLLNIDYMIHVPFNNWFDSQFEEIFEQIDSCIKEGEQCIIMTSAGMGSKVLISELIKKHPQNIYLDIGSGLDKICTRKTTRGWEPTYDELIHELHELLPNDWYNEKYWWIFNEARKKLGVHAMWLNNYK